MLNSTECEIDARLSDTGFLRNFVSKVLLRVASHDQQRPVLELFGKTYSPAVASQPEQSFGTQTDRCNHWPHLGFSIGMQPDAVVTIAIKIT